MFLHAAATGLVAVPSFVGLVTNISAYGQVIAAKKLLGSQVPAAALLEDVIDDDAKSETQ